MDKLTSYQLVTLDRFERWRETTCEALPAEDRYEKQHLYSFGWWPEGEILRTAEFGFRCRPAQGEKFWKHGDIREPARFLMLLEIALRYGPYAIDCCDIDDLADAIEMYMEHVPFDDCRVDIRAPDNIIALQFSTPTQPQDQAAWDAMDKLYQDPATQHLAYLIPDCVDGIVNHPDDIKHVVKFCAAAGVALLDDTGWLVPDWRNMAMRTYVRALSRSDAALPEEKAP